MSSKKTPLCDVLVGAISLSIPLRISVHISKNLLGFQQLLFCVTSCRCDFQHILDFIEYLLEYIRVFCEKIAYKVRVIEEVFPTPTTKAFLSSLFHSLLETQPLTPLRYPLKASDVLLPSLRYYNTVVQNDYCFYP